MAALTRILLALVLGGAATSCAVEQVGRDPRDTRDELYGERGPPSGEVDCASIGGCNFAFRTEPASAYTTQVDFAGLPLVSTVIVNRSDSYNCQGAPNQLEGLDLFRGLLRLHQMWGDDLVREGYTLCSMGAPSGTASPTASNIRAVTGLIPCTSQRMWRRLADGRLVGGLSTFDLISPDFVSMNVDEPAGFPNGQVPWDPITDLVLSLLTDLDDREHTAEKVWLNPHENDVAYPGTFPHLAVAHTELPRPELP